MTEEFLINLGIPAETAEQVLSANQEEISNMQLDYALRDAVAAENPKNLDVALSLLNKEGLTLKDGEVAGLSERLTALKDAHGYLFTAENHPRIVASANGSKQNSISAEQFARMGYQERVRLYRQNPELYKALSE